MNKHEKQLDLPYNINRLEGREYHYTAPATRNCSKDLVVDTGRVDEDHVRPASCHLHSEVPKSINVKLWPGNRTTVKVFD